MIALDNFLINNNTIGEKRVKSTLMSPESTEVPTVTYSKFGTDGRSAAMERSINFLKTQQEAMLKGLHQEIESLKKVNKDLQYRLVMCTCSASDKNLTNVSMEKDEHFLRKEISILQESLENEKRKNAALIKQLEVLQISPSSIKGLPRYKCKDGILSTYPELKTSDVNQRSDQNQDKYGDEIALKDKDAFKKYSDVTMHPHIGINNSSQITTSIPDTSLNKFSSNSSFPIPVKSSLNLSESNLLKRNVIHSFDNECHDKDEKSNKTNGLTGTRLLPIRLPSLNFRKPLIQASLTDQLKTNLPANTTKCSPVNASFEGENIINNKLNRIQRTRSARSVSGYNDITVFDPSFDLPTSSNNPTNSQLQQHHNLNLRKVTQAYSIGLRSFLPSLTKSTDIMMMNQNDRQKKLKNLQRKRAQNNLYPF